MDDKASPCLHLNSLLSNNKLNCITYLIAGYLTLRIRNTRGGRIRILDNIDFVAPINVKLAGYTN